MARRKTLKAQVGDLRLALHVIHAGWVACPWCGKRKPMSANCRCDGWRNAEKRIPDLIDVRTPGTAKE